VGRGDEKERRGEKREERIDGVVATKSLVAGR
jgi:hypothetical protein